MSSFRPDAANNPNDPATWSPARQRMVWAVAFLLVCALSWSAWLSGEVARWDTESDREAGLRQAFVTSVARVQALPSLQAQKVQLQEQVERLEKELPSGAELETVMRAITAAGRARGLQFELFRPAPAVLRSAHAELPVAIRVSGGYHDIGEFLGDIARLPRVVTLHNLSLAPQSQIISADRATAVPSRVLVLDGTLRAYRALSESETAVVRRRDAKGEAGSGAGASAAGISGGAAGAGGATVRSGGAS